MSFPPRQFAALALMAVCVLAAAIVCAFAPLQVGLVAVLIAIGVCTGVVLLFLRKVLSAVYRLQQSNSRNMPEKAETARLTAKAVQRELGTVNARLDRIEQHLPERLAARIAFELAIGEGDSARSRAAGLADR